MSIRRLLHRVPSAKKVAVGILEQHELRFHKISHNDGTAKCDACETGNPEHFLYGVVFHISAEEKPALDKIEGLGSGYEVKDVTVQLHNGKILTAYTYYATTIDPELKPLDWYKEHVLRGARENKLPLEYIREIEIIEHIQDHDIERRDTELSIYR